MTKYILEVEADDYARVKQATGRLPFSVQVQATSTNNLYQIVTVSEREANRAQGRMHRFYRDIIALRVFSEQEQPVVTSDNGELIGCSFMNGKTNLPVVLCYACNALYRGTYPDLQFECELWSTDRWAHHRICLHCGLSLFSAHLRAQQEPVNGSYQFREQRYGVATGIEHIRSLAKQLHTRCRHVDSTYLGDVKTPLTEVQNFLDVTRQTLQKLLDEIEEVEADLQRPNTREDA